MMDRCTSHPFVFYSCETHIQGNLPDSLQSLLRKLFELFSVDLVFTSYVQLLAYHPYI